MVSSEPRDHALAVVVDRQDTTNTEKFNCLKENPFTRIDMPFDNTARMQRLTTVQDNTL